MFQLFSKISMRQLDHYRTRPICRVQIDLPRAFCRALCKGNLCREPDTAALDKDRPSANMPLPRAAVGKKIFAECWALGKIWPSAKVAGVTAATCRQPLPSAPPLGTRQRVFYFFLKKKSLPSALWPSTRQRLLCRVPRLALGKLIFFCFFRPHFFLGPCYSN